MPKIQTSAVTDHSGCTSMSRPRTSSTTPRSDRAATRLRLSADETSAVVRSSDIGASTGSRFDACGSVRASR